MTNGSRKPKSAMQAMIPANNCPTGLVEKEVRRAGPRGNPECRNCCRARRLGSGSTDAAADQGGTSQDADHLFAVHWLKACVRHPWSKQRLLVRTQGRGRVILHCRRDLCGQAGATGYRRSCRNVQSSQGDGNLYGSGIPIRSSCPLSRSIRCVSPPIWGEGGAGPV